MPPSRRPCATGSTAASGLLVLSLVGPAISQAQQRPAGQPPTTGTAPTTTATDVLRGTVVDDSARVIVGATVAVTRGPDRLVQTTTTDDAGRWTVRFSPGTGDYLVSISAPGFRTARRRVQRENAERDFFVRFVLARGVATLAAVQVEARRPERAENRFDRYGAAAAGEQPVEGVNGQIAPMARGDLAAGVVSVGGLTMTGEGPSVLGAGTAQNLVTLNGLALPLGTLPRAARVATRVASAPFDPARGGFSGANIDVRLGPGDRDFQNRNAYVTLVPGALQPTDAVGRATGAQQQQLRASVGADGELVRRALTYNVALDAAHTTNAQVSLLTADPRTLGTSGVAPDAVADVLRVAATRGLPLGTSAPVRRTSVTWLGRLDDTRDSLALRTATTFAALTRADGLGSGALAAPSVTSVQEQATAGAQLVSRDFVGPGRRILVESKLSASLSNTRTDPTLRQPAATVLLPAASLGDPTVAGDSGAVAGVQVAGSAGERRTDRRWTVEGLNETVWLAGGRTHRFRATAWGRYDALRQEAAGDLLGRWTYTSLADLEQNRPAIFTRLLSAPTQDGGAWNAATSLSHQWNRSRAFHVLYGARIEAGGFTARPAQDPRVVSTFGIASRPPTALVHVSPRVGFTWTYSRRRDNGPVGFGSSDLGSFNRGAAGTVRGGIGEFRDLVRPELAARARAATGLADGTALLTCVGAATPFPDWARLGADPMSAPVRCLDGTGGPDPTLLGQRAPSVVVLDDAWRPARSWRSALEWSTVLGGWAVRTNGLASLDLNQPGVVDLNFAGLQRLALGGEGGRPVYAGAAAIDPRTGVVSPRPSRADPGFGDVMRQVSDLRGYGGLATLSLAPSLRPRRPGDIGWPRIYTEFSYTLQGTRRQFRGFDGAAAGDPRHIEWAPANTDARHVLLFQLATNTSRFGAITMFARFQSGLPFTPLVAGDVNGDGRSFDRAFIPAPGLAAAGGDSALASQLAALRADGASNARACLARYAGQMAERNGCRGPWSQMVNLQWRPPLPSRWRGRVTPTVYLENVLGGIDRLLHGGALRGWGAAMAPDPVLLVPRGFDDHGADGARFRYSVNPRFGDTRPTNVAFRMPMRITLDVSIDLSTPYSVQQLRRAVEPVRDRHPVTQGGAIAVRSGSWRPQTSDEVLQLYLNRTSSLAKRVLSESDSLLLTAEQITALRRIDGAFSDSVVAIYRPLAEHLAGRERVGASDLDRAQAAERLYWTVFWRQPELVDAVLTPVQRELVPFVGRDLSVPPGQRAGLKVFFGFPVTLPTRAPEPAGAVP